MPPSFCDGASRLCQFHLSPEAECAKICLLNLLGSALSRYWDKKEKNYEIVHDNSLLYREG